MTIDELVKIYRAAYWGVKRAEDDGDSAGIRAVVEALRDELRREWFLDDSGQMDLNFDCGIFCEEGSEG